MNIDEGHSDHLPDRSEHGAHRPRGLGYNPRSIMYDGRFGRLFRRLPPLWIPDDALAALAGSMADPESGAGSSGSMSEAGDNPDMPAGYTYLGQFVDHDITFDPASSLERSNDPDALHNFRTPRLDLDSLYGSGPAASPHLYDQEDPVKLLIGRNPAPVHEPEDLPRNHQGTALVGDPRNDVHVIVAQLHLAFLRFHNAAVDHLRSVFHPADRLFDEAQRLTRWHYQWVVVHDYLRLLVGPELLEEVMATDGQGGDSRARGRFYSWKRRPFLPVEFSAAAFRFGHSQVRGVYRLNDTLDPLPILTETRVAHPVQHLGGFRPLPRGWTVQWPHFFVVDGSVPQPSRRIDTKVTEPLLHLPPSLDPQRRSLALLNLLRGRALGLPSGQAVARAVGSVVPGGQLGLEGETPLWFYLLRESEVLAEGRRLGPTAGRIVAEVLVGLLIGDPSSFLATAPNWRPELPGQRPGRFTMVDLLRFAGVVGNGGHRFMYHRSR